MLLYEALQYYILSFDLPKKILIKVNIGFIILIYSYINLKYK
jgi:hypothetical protein